MRACFLKNTPLADCALTLFTRLSSVLFRSVFFCSVPNVFVTRVCFVRIFISCFLSFFLSCCTKKLGYVGGAAADLPFPIAPFISSIPILVQRRGPVFPHTRRRRALGSDFFSYSHKSDGGSLSHIPIPLSGKPQQLFRSVISREFHIHRIPSQTPITTPPSYRPQTSAAPLPLHYPLSPSPPAPSSSPSGSAATSPRRRPRSWRHAYAHL